MPDSPSVPVEAQDAILAWYAENGRSLAFRGTADPYAILVSEVIAQQTQAARAAERWTRFMARFPTIADLAAASPADVLREWQGLGYNRRALALLHATRRICGQRGGSVPSSVRDLEALPGIGPYTARAVAAIAFGKPVGAVDVNVRRVLGRLAVGDPHAMRHREFQRFADSVVPRDRAAPWTHALMDLGALLCKPRAPLCGDCPVEAWCQYQRSASSEQHAAKPRARRRSASFKSTNRWLRGRLVALLAAAQSEVWIELPRSLGVHDADAVDAAASGLERDGLLEVRDGYARIRT